MMKMVKCKTGRYFQKDFNYRFKKNPTAVHCRETLNKVVHTEWRTFESKYYRLLF